MRNKKIVLALPIFFMLLGLVACGAGGGGDNDEYEDITPVYNDNPLTGSGKITVWVGKESVEFYQDVADEWVAAKAALSSDFKFTVEVAEHDTGTVAGDLINDASVCADIYTSGHDNIGKLASGKYAKPFYDGYLYDQILAENSESFSDVCYSVVDGKRAFYGSPYIGQSLFLMYNKAYVTEEQAQTFEGLQAAAAAASTPTKIVNAVTVTGTDGYNYSFNLLAQNNVTHSTTLKLYEGGAKTTGSCWSQGDDAVANLKWAQRYYGEANGLAWPSSSGWEQDLFNAGTLSLISGAWKYKAFASAVGASNVGVAMLPTYTLTAADVEGTSVAVDTVMRGGTFSDVKVFLINGYSNGSKYLAEQDLVKYLSGKAIQQQSFIQCDNLPAYAGAATDISNYFEDGIITESSYQMAVAQNNMFAYGIPQPFVTGTFNTYYYSKGAPALYQLAVENANDDYAATRSLREILYRMQFIWQKGQEAAKIPSTLPTDI